MGKLTSGEMFETRLLRTVEASVGVDVMMASGMLGSSDLLPKPGKGQQCTGGLPNTDTILQSTTFHFYRQWVFHCPEAKMHGAPKVAFQRPKTGIQILQGGLVKGKMSNASFPCISRRHNLQKSSRKRTGV